MFEKTTLTFKLIAYVFGFFGSFLGRTLHGSFNRLRGRFASAPNINESERKNIVIIGANFAGYYTASYIVDALPPGSPYTVVVIEPHSHFNFTWVLPRFCVVEGHEHKALIPYTGFNARNPKWRLRWIRDRVTEVKKGCVVLQEGEEVPYEYLVVATGAGASTVGLPSRLASDDKPQAIADLREMQGKIKEAKQLVIVGGGAAGVELATDAKFQYSDKSVTLVHSRDAVMHRFGPKLQQEAFESLQRLGVEVILGERLVDENKEEGFVTLRSGRTVPCDFLVTCAGQRPVSDVLSNLCPRVILPTGHIRTKLTMQIDDEQFPNIYACGDVVETSEPNPNPNSRTAFCQALVVIDNILLATKGKAPKHKYKAHWADSTIKLTLGYDKTVMYLTDDKNTMMWSIKNPDITLDAWKAWRQLGVKAFVDDDGSATSKV